MTVERMSSEDDGASLVFHGEGLNDSDLAEVASSLYFFFFFL